MTKGRTPLLIAVLVGLLGLGTWIADKPPWTRTDSAAVEAVEPQDDSQTAASNDAAGSATDASDVEDEADVVAVDDGAEDAAPEDEASNDGDVVVATEAPSDAAGSDDTVTGLANSAAEQAGELADKVTEGAGEIASQIAEEATILAETAADQAEELAGAAAEQAAAIADDAAEKAEAAATAVAEAVEAAPETLSKAADVVADTASQASDTVAGVVGSVTEAAKDAADNVVGAITGEDPSPVVDLSDGSGGGEAADSPQDKVAGAIDQLASDADVADLAEDVAELDVGEEAANAIAGIADGTDDTSSAAQEAVADVAEVANETVADTVAQAGDSAATITDKTVDGVADSVADVSDALKDTAGESVTESASQVAALTSTDTGATDVLSNPKFDALRVNQFGDLVVAGQAAPNSTVTILDGQRVVGTVVADARGDWVFLPESALEPGNYELTVRSEAEAETLESNEAIVLVVPERGKTIAGQEAQDQGEDGSLALLVSRDELDASRVLQAPTAPAEVVNDQQQSAGDQSTEQSLDEKPVIAEVDPSVEKPPLDQPVNQEPVQVAINTIDYDEQGDVIVAGQATADSEVRLYVDDELAGSTTTDPEGEYVVEPEKEIAAGDYTLRVDQVDDDGAVESRAAIPFTRATVEQVEQVASLPGSVTVQPGNSLWRIARRVYGEGIRYTVIYQANADHIRDPDLIYPGQIFVLPDDREEG